MVLARCWSIQASNLFCDGARSGPARRTTISSWLRSSRSTSTRTSSPLSSFNVAPSRIEESVAGGLRGGERDESRPRRARHRYGPADTAQRLFTILRDQGLVENNMERLILAPATPRNHRGGLGAGSVAHVVAVEVAEAVLASAAASIAYLHKLLP